MRNQDVYNIFFISEMVIKANKNKTYIKDLLVLGTFTLVIGIEFFFIYIYNNPLRKGWLLSPFETGNGGSERWKTKNYSVYKYWKLRLSPSHPTLSTYMFDASVRECVILVYHNYLFSVGFSLACDILLAKKQALCSSNFRTNKVPGTQESLNKWLWVNEGVNWGKYLNSPFIKYNQKNRF